MAATAVATTLIPNNAQAVLNIYLFDDTNGNLTIESRGTLNLGTPPGGGVICTETQPSAQIFADQSILYQCDSDQTAYPITFAGGSNIWGSSSTKLDSTSFSGTQFNLIGSGGIFSTNIADGAPINATAVFTNSITDLGLNGGSGPRLLASYKLDATRDTISLFADTPLPPSPLSVPAPLPLFGTAAAFSWSRRLRRRISGSP
jgi:hypothetical protein